MRSRWLQIRGDSTAGRSVFEHGRVQNEFDMRIDQVLARVEALILRHGVFHAKMHFSSGQVTLWLINDPLRYRVHVKEEFLDPDICLAYPCQPYTEEALVPTPEIAKVLAEFKLLRTQDNHIYLRSASLNVVNGLVGLNFSCEGSHYLNYAEFLTHAGNLYV
jgi:hypothetical protein